MLLLFLGLGLGGCSSALPPGGGVDSGLPAGRCASQGDCADGTVCQPSAPGSSTGTCQPPSTRHCAACAADAECGAGGLCFQPPGDVVKACHIDCSLSWLACPSGYNCLSVLHGDEMRHVCLPVSYRCGDVGGGPCSPGDSEPCTRTNSAGTCTGVRVCDNGQLGPCGAPEPVFLQHCGDLPPAGCDELPSPAALSTVTDCGSCGNACPGAASATADAACVDPAAGTCGITCRGDNYDVDGSAANGCEVPDPDPSHHLQSAAKALPASSCDDTSSQNSFQGRLLSDTRQHVPAVTGFVSTAGAAPHWYSVFGSGGVCTDDYAFTLTTTGGTAVPCYQATILTDKTTSNVTVSGAGSASTIGGASSYSDDTTIYFRVEKICSTASVGGDDVAYTVSYHL